MTDPSLTNSFLARLGPESWARLQPDLKEVTLVLNKTIYTRAIR